MNTAILREMVILGNWQFDLPKNTSPAVSDVCVMISVLRQIETDIYRQGRESVSQTGKEMPINVPTLHIIVIPINYRCCQ